jgi:hypothetical protein
MNHRDAESKTQSTVLVVDDDPGARCSSAAPWKSPGFG